MNLRDGSPRLNDQEASPLSGGGSHTQTMDMHIDDGRTWLGQLHHFVTRAACTLWRPACRGVGRGGQWTALAVGMAVALAASPGQAVPAMPAGGFGMPTPVSRVNAVSPRFTDTPAWHVTETGEQHLKRMSEVIPLARPGTTEEIAKAVVFLASDDSSSVTGTELFVDGGFAQV